MHEVESGEVHEVGEEEESQVKFVVFKAAHENIIKIMGFNWMLM